MTVELTEQEANQLIGLLDVAVKANGLQAASVALLLVAKLQKAFTEKKAEKAE